jgi:hypothetical protein
MEASFMLPSCTYNLVLSEEDLVNLLETGHIYTRISKDVPCRTGRAVWFKETSTMKTLDRKQIPNNLLFYLEEDVADIEGGDWHVQFLNIHIEGFKKKENENA